MRVIPTFDLYFKLIALQLHLGTSIAYTNDAHDVCGVKEPVRPPRWCVTVRNFEEGRRKGAGIGGMLAGRRDRRAGLIAQRTATRLPLPPQRSQPRRSTLRPHPLVLSPVPPSPLLQVVTAVVEVVAADPAVRPGTTTGTKATATLVPPARKALLRAWRHLVDSTASVSVSPACWAQGLLLTGSSLPQGQPRP